LSNLIDSNEFKKYNDYILVNKWLNFMVKYKEENKKWKLLFLILMGLFWILM
jgi:hypothetical protein